MAEQCGNQLDNESRSGAETVFGGSCRPPVQTPVKQAGRETRTEFMLTHNERDRDQWSYYDEFIKSKKIKKVRVPEAEGDTCREGSSDHGIVSDLPVPVLRRVLHPLLLAVQFHDRNTGAGLFRLQHEAHVQKCFMGRGQSAFRRKRPILFDLESRGTLVPVVEICTLGKAVEPVSQPGDRARSHTGPVQTGHRNSRLGLHALSL